MLLEGQFLHSSPVNTATATLFPSPMDLKFCLFCSFDVFLLKLHSFFVKLNKIFCTYLQSTQLVPVHRLEILEALHHVGVSGAVGEAVARVPALDGGQALVQRRGRGLELDVLRAQPAMAGVNWEYLARDG